MCYLKYIYVLSLFVTSNYIVLYVNITSISLLYTLYTLQRVSVNSTNLCCIFFTSRSERPNPYHPTRNQPRAVRRNPEQPVILLQLRDVATSRWHHCPLPTVPLTTLQYPWTRKHTRTSCTVACFNRWMGQKYPFLLGLLDFWPIGVTSCLLERAFYSKRCSALLTVSSCTSFVKR